MISNRANGDHFGPDGLASSIFPMYLLGTMDTWIKDNAPWLDLPFSGNPVWLWLAAALLAVVVLGILLVIRALVVSRLKSLAEKTKNKIDDAIADVFARTHILFLVAVAILTGATILELGARWDSLRKILVIVALVQGGLWGVGLLLVTLARWREKKAEDPSAKTVIGAMGFMGKLGIWSVVLLLALQNLGVDISTLLAVGGVSGIAVALAVQGILGDLFASVSILMDKPFQVGDFIIVGDMMGVVEHVGLKTTRVRSLSGEELIFSNSDLLGSRIRNYRAMKERRVPFSVGVTYQTPHAKLEAIPGMIREIVESKDDVRFDRCHFKKLGDFSLDFETVYHMLKPDYTLYMETQQAINLGIFMKFEKEKIEFAYPTQTLIVEKPGGEASP